MPSENEISRHCFSRTLKRARQIAASDRNILTKLCRYNRNATVLSAFVASSSGWDDRYRTSVSFDEEADLITDYSCTCPASFEYDGMCKHCAALALSYNAAPEKFMGYRTHREAATSACLVELMKRAEQAACAEKTGAVDIETTLVYGYRSWSARFKLAGPEGSYVMGGISDFVERMRLGRHYSYGKKLSFAHIPDMLTEPARAVARFLDRAVEVRAQAGRSVLGYSGSRSEVGRDLDLSDSEVVELLDALGEQTFTVQGTDYGTRSHTRAHIVREDPYLTVSLHEADEGGYAVACADEIVLASYADRLYVWQDDVFYRCSADFARCAGFLRGIDGSEDEQLYIGEGDLPLFCATVLPAIEQHLHVLVPPGIEAYRPVPCRLEFYFDKTSKEIVCDARAVYGERSWALLGREDARSDTQQTAGPLRDERLETRAKRLVERYFGPAEPLIDLKDDEAVAQLVFGGMAEFQALGTAFTTPAFDRLISDRNPRVTLGVSLSGNLINLTVSAEDLPASELSAVLSSYRKRKRYHRLRNGAFLDLADADLSQLERIAADLGITAKQLASGVVELPSYRAFYLDEEQDLDRDRSFTRYVDGLRRAEERAWQVPETLQGTLRPYQEEGFRWLNALFDRGFGGILADEMGLGKSLQLIALLLARRSEARQTGPSLVVCPASLVYNWTAEFERFAPELSVQAVVGTKRERQRIRQRRGCDVMVTSYDLLRIDADEFAESEFFCCALDEAQYVKNPAALTTRAVKRVRANHRLALTGTPMENRLSELWSIFDFLMPGLLGPYMRFRERFELDIVGGDEDAARRLQALAGPFMLRRLKADVLVELPDKLESVLYTPIEGKQRQLYAAHEQQLREMLTAQRRTRKEHGRDERRVEVLAELTKLRQLCCDPRLLYEDYEGPAAKLDAIVELVGSVRDAGRKALVFSQFTSFLSLIAERLDRLGVSYYTITGATPKKKRLDLVNAFNEDSTPVFLVSLKAGGTGLNLVGAADVIHADPWWNAAAQDQATDRAHRIGQTKEVTVHKVIAKGTVEERILHLQEAKSELAGRIIGEGGVSLAALSAEELADLLQG